MAFINKWITDYALETVDAVQVEKILQPTDLCRCVAAVKLESGVEKQQTFLALVSSKKYSHESAVFILRIGGLLELGSIQIQEVIPITRDFVLKLATTDDLGFTIELMNFRWTFVAKHAVQRNQIISELNKAQHIASTTKLSLSWLFSYLEPTSKYFVYLKTFQQEASSKEGTGEAEIAAVLFDDLKKEWLKMQMDARKDKYSMFQQLKIFTGTWNVGISKPEDNIADWLRNDISEDETNNDKIDIYVLGFQEIDMGAEALLLNDQTKSRPWEETIERALAVVKPNDKYSLLISKQMVGVLLCIYVHQDHMPAIKNLQFDVVECGVMRVLGNKGAVSIRFQFHETTFCFVNSHLAAFAQNTERRNQDWQDIVKFTAFKIFDSGLYGSNTTETVLSILDHDVVFWLGDLNYHINLPDEEVRAKIEAKEFDYLLQFDQLSEQRKLGRVFQGFEEGQITFAPTYKYTVGANTYDKSVGEKKRTPAYTDRILWMKKDDSVVKKQLFYRRTDLLTSDHKAVSSIFITNVQKIIPDEYQKHYSEVIKMLDQLENQGRPSMSLSDSTVDFGVVTFGTAISKSLTVQNTGKIPVHFQFIPKLGEQSLSKPWLTIKPQASILKVDESAPITFSILVDKRSAPVLNSKIETLEDILILHIEGGKDDFITIKGDYQVSCFGTTIEELLVSSKNKPNLPENVPGQVVSLCKYILSHCLEKEGLFVECGDPQMNARIRECVDKDEEFPPDSVYSVAETLLLLLESLAEPVIPYSLYSQILETTHSVPETQKTVFTILPKPHIQLFLYLVGFMRDLTALNPLLTPDRLATIFANVIMPLPLVGMDAGKGFSGDFTTVQKKRELILIFIQDTISGKKN